MSCPAQTQIADCLSGKLDEPVSRALFAHLETCDHCQEVADKLDDLSDSFIGEIRASSVMLDSQTHESCFEMIEKVESLAVGAGDSETLDALGNAPRRIRDYQILEPLGAGGMGEVYRARHIRLKRDVAIKLIKKKSTNSEVALRFFQQEMEAVGRLEPHPHLVQALDAGEHEGVQYLVMQLVDGQNAEQLLREKEYLDVADICEIGRQAALGLHYAHQQGLIHRDVKPANLMVSAGGAVQVMDLGLSMFRSAEGAMKQVLGSVQYMAPEQADRNAEVDVRTDVYALGGTLYYLLTGKAPHQALSYKSLKRRVSERTKVSLSTLAQIRKDVPLPLRELLEETLSPAVEDRPVSAAVFAKRISQFSEGSDLFALMSEHREGAARGEAIVAEIADMPASEVDESGSNWSPFKLALFGAFAIASIVLSVAVWQTMFPAQQPDANGVTNVGQDDVVGETNPTIANPTIAEPFEPERIDYQFCLRAEGQEYLFTNSPGYELSAAITEIGSEALPTANGELKAWDALEFRTKYPEEFELYDQGWELAEADFEQLFPYPGSPIPDELRFLRKAEIGKSERRVYVRESERSILLIGFDDGRIRMSVSYAGGRSDSEFASAEQMREQSSELSSLYLRYSGQSTAPE